MPHQREAIPWSVLAIYHLILFPYPFLPHLFLAVLLDDLQLGQLPPPLFPIFLFYLRIGLINDDKISYS